MIRFDSPPRLIKKLAATLRQVLVYKDSRVPSTFSKSSGLVESATSSVSRELDDDVTRFVPGAVLGGRPTQTVTPIDVTDVNINIDGTCNTSDDIIGTFIWLFAYTRNPKTISPAVLFGCVNSIFKF